MRMLQQHGARALRPPIERKEPEEGDTAAQISAAMQKIRKTAFAGTGHASRSVHAKGQGHLRGRLRVAEKLPVELAQSLFASAGDDPVLMRLSAIPGDILDDKVSVPRGLTVKLTGVSSARPAGSEGDLPQGLLFVDAPTSNAPNPKKFLSRLEQLEAKTEQANGAKKVLSTTLQALVWIALPATLSGARRSLSMCPRRSVCQPSGNPPSNLSSVTG